MANIKIAGFQSNLFEELNDADLVAVTGGSNGGTVGGLVGGADGAADKTVDNTLYATLPFTVDGAQSAIGLTTDPAVSFVKGAV
jgi:hypothetical protein